MAQTYAVQEAGSCTPDEARTPMPPVRKVVTWLVVAFVLYAILTSPEPAANMVGSAWAVVLNGFSNVGHFFDALISRS